MLSLHVCLAILGLCWGNSANAQIIRDESLGNEASKLTPNMDIKDLPAELIEGGAKRGANLFHSFREFNIGDSQRVYFNNPAGIENILTRVTGGKLSNILGTLGVNGSANLFLINPSGIVFGENARLDLGGSFVASTANAVKFGEDSFFSAIFPDIPSDLLRVKPSALLFNQIQAGKIENRSIAPIGDNLFGLRVAGGRSLLLVGGEMEINGGGLYAPGGRVELAGVADTGTIGLNFDGNNLSLKVPEDIRLADISLNNQSFVSSSGESSSKIELWGRQITLSGGSRIETNTLGNIPGLGLSVNASESVRVIGESPTGIRSGLFSETFGDGDAGDLTINSKQLEILAGGKVSTGTKEAAGNAGNLTVNASEKVKVSGLTVDGELGSDLFSNSGSRATGKAGNITINTKKLFVEDGGQIAASTFGKAIAGNLTVNASEAINIIGIPDNPQKGNTGIFAQSEGIGNPGNLNITTKDLFMENGGGISADNFGTSSGGSITVNASESVKLIGTTADPQTPQFGFSTRIDARSFNAGASGDISINTKNLLLKDGARVSSETQGSGVGGGVTVNASESIKLSGTAINSNSFIDFPSQISTRTIGTGNAGDLNITSKQLTVENGAQLSATTFNVGNSGNLIVNASESVRVIENRANISFFTGLLTQAIGMGNAGTIDITTGELFIKDGARVSSATVLSGKGGDLTINASDSVQLIGIAANERVASGLSTGTLGSGNSGDLTINTKKLLIQDGGQIISGTNNSSSTGAGGNLTVNASESVEMIGGKGDFPSVLSSVTDGEGDAGKIKITTRQLSVRDGAQIQTSTDVDSKGNAGNLEVNVSEYIHIIGTTPGGEFPSALVANTSGIGNAGKLILNGKQLLIDDGAEISASTSGGEGGSIFVDFNSLEAKNGGRLRTSTSANNRAGSITLKVADNIILSGADSGIFANSTP